MALADNLEAYYSLDESSGDAADATGNGYTLTNFNSCGYSSAVINNGSDAGSGNTTDYLRYGGTILSAAQIAGNASMAFWVNFYDVTTFKWITGLYSGGATGKGFRIFISSGTCGVQYSVSSSIGSSSLSTGTWYHFVVTNDGTNVRWYKDGSFVTSTSYSGTNQSTTASLNLHWSEGVGESKSATIFDEVGIWSKTLTADEVSELYNSGNGLSYTDITGGGFTPKIMWFS